MLLYFNNVLLNTVEFISLSSDNCCYLWISELSMIE